MSESLNNAPNPKSEINFLQRLQTAGEIEGRKWSEEDFIRLEKLRKKKEASDGKGEPTEEQRQRFTELNKLQIEGGENWTSELQEELKKLHQIFDK